MCQSRHEMLKECGKLCRSDMGGSAIVSLTRLSNGAIIILSNVNKV